MENVEILEVHFDAVIADAKIGLQEGEMVLIIINFKVNGNNREEKFSRILISEAITTVAPIRRRIFDVCRTDGLKLNGGLFPIVFDFYRQAYENRTNQKCVSCIYEESENIRKTKEYKIEDNGTCTRII